MTVAEHGPFDMLVAGQRLREGSLGTVGGENPTTEEPLPSVAHAGAPEVDRAVAAAWEASHTWRQTGWRERSDVLRKLADRARGAIDELAALDTESCGLPLAAAKADVESGCQALEYFGGLASELTGTVYPPGSGVPALSLRQPCGVVGRILAFNHPVQFVLGKAAAPLAAGNAVLLKPSEHSPYSALRIAELAEEVLPKGVLTVLTGEGATTGSLIVEHPDVPRVAATGGIATGRAILQGAAEHIKHVTLELGGKNPLLAFTDADPQLVAEAAVRGMNFTRSQGQSCGSTSRLLVHESQHDEVVEAVVAQVADIAVGDPFDPGTDMGPLAFRAHHERVTGYIESGLAEGATLALGGRRPAARSRGFFLEPAVFIDVEPGMRIAREEIFGPVLSVLRWRTQEELLAIANGTEHGLTASVWTEDLRTAHETAGAVDAGLVWVNTVARRDLTVPWGGLKASGLGKEYGRAELESFTVEKSVMHG